LPGFRAQAFLINAEHRSWSQGKGSRASTRHTLEIEDNSGWAAQAEAGIEADDAFGCSQPLFRIDQTQRDGFPGRGDLDLEGSLAVVLLFQGSGAGVFEPDPDRAVPYLSPNSLQEGFISRFPDNLETLVPPSPL
jgi:hypothetical protein